MVARRGWLAWAVATAVALGLVLWAATPAPADLPSSYSAGSTGLLALYRLLAQEGVAVGRRTSPALPSSGILVAAAGAAPISPGAVRQLLAWARAGHRMIVLGSVPALARALGVTEAADLVGGGDAQAALPLPDLRGASRLAMPGDVLLIPSTRGLALYERGGVPAALRLVEGRGRIDWFGSAEIWSNGTLAQDPGNVALAENLLRGGQPVWFGEYWFGAARARQAVARARPAGQTLPMPRAWQLAALILAAAAGTALWSAGWRRHPIRPAGPPQPSAVDELLARAALRERTGGRRMDARNNDAPENDARKSHLGGNRVGGSRVGGNRVDG